MNPSRSESDSVQWEIFLTDTLASSRNQSLSVTEQKKILQENSQLLKYLTNYIVKEKRLLFF